MTIPKKQSTKNSYNIHDVTTVGLFYTGGLFSNSMKELPEFPNTPTLPKDLASTITEHLSVQNRPQQLLLPEQIRSILTQHRREIQLEYASNVQNFALKEDAYIKLQQKQKTLSIMHNVNIVLKAFDVLIDVGYTKKTPIYENYKHTFKDVGELVSLLGGYKTSFGFYFITTAVAIYENNPNELVNIGLSVTTVSLSQTLLALIASPYLSIAYTSLFTAYNAYSVIEKVSYYTGYENEFNRLSKQLYELPNTLMQSLKDSFPKKSDLFTIVENNMPNPQNLATYQKYINKAHNAISWCIYNPKDCLFNLADNVITGKFLISSDEQ